MKILITGACGFIAKHVIKKLQELGHEVVGYDLMDYQVHRDAFENSRQSDVFSKPPCKVTFMSAGSISPNAYRDVEVVIHLGAKVGVGQSMYLIDDYVHMNTMDTAKFLRGLTEHKPKRLVVASSMSIYGEGAVRFDDPYVESFTQGYPMPTPESHPADLRSIYALTKYDQEKLCLIWGKSYLVPTVALRFFNTYGPGQSLNNPYTGVLAIFASRLLNDKPPVIYEDGQQTRDFIHVDDVANAVVHAALNDIPSGAYNVGTGVATSIQNVADLMSVYLAKSEDSIIDPIITGAHRKGDIRHCFADIGKLMSTGWCPQVKFQEGLMEYCAWLQTQPKPEDKFDKAHAELVDNGLCK